MNDLVEAINHLTNVVEASGLFIVGVLVIALLFKGSSTNEELREIRKELKRLREDAKHE